MAPKMWSLQVQSWLAVTFFPKEDPIQWKVARQTISAFSLYEEYKLFPLKLISVIIVQGPIILESEISILFFYCGIDTVKLSKL